MRAVLALENMLSEPVLLTHIPCRLVVVRVLSEWRFSFGCVRKKNARFRKFFTFCNVLCDRGQLQNSFCCMLHIRLASHV